MTDRPRRLLVWTGAEEYAGAEEALTVLVAALPASVAVTVAGHQREIIDAIGEGRPAIHRVLAPRVATARELVRLPAVQRLIADLQPDVVHLNKTEVADLRYIELLLQLSGRARIVSVVHHVEPPVTRPARLLTQWLAGRATRVVAVGRAPGSELGAILGLPVGRVAVIPNALPPLVGPSTRPPPAAGTGPRPVTVGVLARFVRHKAVDHIVSAVAPLGDVRLLVGGDGPDRDHIERTVWRLRLQHRVRLLGWVPPERVLEHSDVVVSAARIEGHPMSLLDARRRGLPIVATNVGAVPEIVEHGVTGLLVEPGDVTGLTAAIDRLTSDARLRAQLGRAGLAASSTWLPDDVARAYQSLYWDVADPDPVDVHEPYADLAAGGR